MKSLKLKALPAHAGLWVKTSAARKTTLAFEAAASEVDEGTGQTEF